MSGQRAHEEFVGDRVGRFNKRFEGIGGGKSGARGSVDWMDIGEGVEEVNDVSKHTSKDAKEK